MFVKSKKFIFGALASLSALLFTAAGATAATRNGRSAYAYSELPTESVIENIFDYDTGKFVAENLNALAKAADSSYADIDALIKDVKNNNKTIKSSAFGSATVKFGKAANGDGEELVWIPAYISDDTRGNPVLTLWLAGTESGNSDGKSQEVSRFSDGTLRNSATPAPSSNNYSTSYIRALINNGGIITAIGTTTPIPILR